MVGERKNLDMSDTVFSYLAYMRNLCFHIRIALDLFTPLLFAVGTDIVMIESRDPGVYKMQIFSLGDSCTLGSLQAIAQLAVTDTRDEAHISGRMLLSVYITRDLTFLCRKHKIQNIRKGMFNCNTFVSHALFVLVHFCSLYRHCHTS